MASLEQIDSLLKQLEKAPPSESFHSIDGNSAGIQAILKYLKDSDKEVTAGEISKRLEVSTARIAVLLKKMAAKSLIVRRADEKDARVVLVALSPHGEEAARQIEAEIIGLVGKMIDRIGMERMLEFADISLEIKKILQEPSP